MADARFADRVAARQTVVAVVGLGYVGLPLAIAYAQAGFRTIGLDVDEGRIEALGEGVSHVDDVADAAVATAVVTTFEPTIDAARLRDADVIFLCVPTPFDATKTPDLSFVRAAGHTVAETLQPGTLVVLQSTTYPGTTVEVLQPILEAVSGLKRGNRLPPRVLTRARRSRERRPGRSRTRRRSAAGSPPSARTPRACCSKR